MIKIGVTPCILYADENRDSFAPKFLDYMVQDMARYLKRDGVLPILIPSLPSDELRSFVIEMDGIVLQGGVDVAPETYKEKPIGKWKGDANRDAIELEILKYALEIELPVFGICRGFQLMNVFFGGTLYQDIPTQFKSDTMHKATDYDQNTHMIRIKENSFLYKINNRETEARVNSVHHQGIKKLGDKLIAVAWDKGDGTIEAFEANDYPEGKVMGVQWHPEYNWNHKEQLLPADKLLDQFLHYCI